MRADDERCAAYVVGTMITTVLATVALAATLQDRSLIVHDFKSDQPLAYDLTFTARLPDGDSVSKARFEIKPLRTYQNGNTDIELRMDKVRFVEGEVEHAFKSAVFRFTLTKTGIPVDSVFDSIESMASASLIALFLPAKQMAEGEGYDYKYDGDSLDLRFKGRLEGFVDHDGRQLAKIVTTGTIEPKGEAVAEIDLTTLYDAAGRRVVEAHAVLKLPWGDIEIDLVAIG